MIPAFRFSGGMMLATVVGSTPSPARSATERLPSRRREREPEGWRRTVSVPSPSGRGRGEGADRDREFDRRDTPTRPLHPSAASRRRVAPIREVVHAAAEYRRDSRVGLGTFFRLVGDHRLLDEAADQALQREVGALELGGVMNRAGRTRLAAQPAEHALGDVDVELRERSSTWSADASRPRSRCNRSGRRARRPGSRCKSRGRLRGCRDSGTAACPAPASASDRDTGPCRACA